MSEIGGEGRELPFGYIKINVLSPLLFNFFKIYGFLRCGVFWLGKCSEWCFDILKCGFVVFE